ncbi:uncharacterized protein LOC142596200 [Pelecanus crispus]|uniref:uncharacterized protein LOC142596200 n=1 Tax=Pelecanus crispus TaxID=36300 RepID=UPI003F5D1645
MIKVRYRTTEKLNRNISENIPRVEIPGRGCKPQKLTTEGTLRARRHFVRLSRGEWRARRHFVRLSQGGRGERDAILSALEPGRPWRARAAENERARERGSPPTEPQLPLPLPPALPEAAPGEPALQQPPARCGGIRERRQGRAALPPPPPRLLAALLPLPAPPPGPGRSRHGPAPVSSLFSRLFGEKRMRVVMAKGRWRHVGLEAAVKTTILCKLKLGIIITTIAAIGLNVETVVYKNIHFTVWDVGGQGKIRRPWRHYFQSAQGLIFVVDSNDRERIQEAAEELQKMLQEDELRDAVLLLFANKQDLPNAMSVSEVTDKLGLQSLRNRTWHVQGTCATEGTGLHEGLAWLSNELSKR